MPDRNRRLRIEKLQVLLNLISICLHVPANSSAQARIWYQYLHWHIYIQCPERRFTEIILPQHYFIYKHTPTERDNEELQKQFKLLSTISNAHSTFHTHWLINKFVLLKREDNHGTASVTTPDIFQCIKIYSKWKTGQKGVISTVD